MIRHAGRDSWLTDIYLILFLALLGGLGIGMAATHTHFLLINVLFLGGDLLLDFTHVFFGNDHWVAG